MTDTNTTSPAKTEVQTLREAAGLMRDRAQHATPGPWHARADGNSWALEGVERFRNYTNDVQVGTDGSTARHIASWHPAVALAVADWLDFVADAYEPCRETTQALTVARTYLGVEIPA